MSKQQRDDEDRKKYLYIKGRKRKKKFTFYSERIVVRADEKTFAAGERESYFFFWCRPER